MMQGVLLAVSCLVNRKTIATFNEYPIPLVGYYSMCQPLQANACLILTLPMSVLDSWIGHVLISVTNIDVIF
jgi:hypothetical protein